MQQVSITYVDNSQFANVLDVTHAKRNLNGIASVNSILLDFEARQRDILFDNTIWLLMLLLVMPLNELMQILLNLNLVTTLRIMLQIVK